MVFRSLYCSPVQFLHVLVGSLEIESLQQIGLKLPAVKSVAVTLLRRVSFHTEFYPNRSMFESMGGNLFTTMINLLNPLVT